MGIIIGEKNPRLVKSEDVGNLARMNYGKPVAETTINEKEPANKAAGEPNMQEVGNSINGKEKVVVEKENDKQEQSADADDKKQPTPKKGGRPKKS